MRQNDVKTILTLRRMRRKSLGFWAWNAFGTAKAHSEELRFDILDGNRKLVGRIVCSNPKMSKSLEGCALSTPWGEGRIEPLGGEARIILDNRELALWKMDSKKREMLFTFPNGTHIQFEGFKRNRYDIEYRSESGYIGFFREEGTLPEGASNRSVAMSREEIKALPKKDRPRSIETNDYIQFRIDIGGVLPVREDDIIKALCILSVFSRLKDEEPPSNL